MSQALKQRLKQRLEEKKEEVLKEKGIDVELLRSVGPITLQNLPMLLWQHPHILPEETRNKIIKRIQDFSTNLFVDILTGIAFNLLATKLYPRIRKMPAATRLPLRLSLFSLPFGGTYPILNEHFSEYQRLAETAVKVAEKGRKALQAKEGLK